MRPKSIGWLHSECAQMLEFSDGFQVLLVALHVVQLPQGFRSMNLIVVGRLIRIRPVPNIIQFVLVCAIVVGAIVVGIFFNVAGGLIGSSGGLRLGGVRLQ